MIGAKASLHRNSSKRISEASSWRIGTAAPRQTTLEARNRSAAQRSNAREITMRCTSLVPS